LRVRPLIDASAEIPNPGDAVTVGDNESRSVDPARQKEERCCVKLDGPGQRR
jgi:hypothetical protein